jgi:hypothetical protein
VPAVFVELDIRHDAGCTVSLEWDRYTGSTQIGVLLEPVSGQTVVAHGPERNLSVDEIGGIDLVDDAAVAEA